MKKFILLFLTLMAAPLFAANLPADNSLPPSPEWAKVEAPLL